MIPTGEEQDERKDLAILGCVITLTAFFATVAGSIAIGYWLAGVKFL